MSVSCSEDFSRVWHVTFNNKPPISSPILYEAPMSGPLEQPPPYNIKPTTADLPYWQASHIKPHTISSPLIRLPTISSPQAPNYDIKPRLLVLGNMEPRLTISSCESDLQYEAPSIRLWIWSPDLRYQAPTYDIKPLMLNHQYEAPSYHIRPRLAISSPS